MDLWKTIDSLASAPREEIVLIFVPDDNEGKVMVGRLDRDYVTWRVMASEAGDFRELRETPSHWMPLPPPPNN